MPLKLILAVAAFAFASSGCYASRSSVPSKEGASEVSPDARTVLDSVVAISQRSSLYADGQPWDQIRRQMLVVAARHDSIDQVGKPVEYMLGEIGDVHGTLMYEYRIGYNSPQSASAIASTRDSTYAVLQSTKIRSPYVVDTAFLDSSRVAYIEIPGTGYLPADSVTSAATTIREAICELKRHDPAGWIVDLRSNIGGNMNPMMVGLGELISDAELGGDTRDGGATLAMEGSYVDGVYLQNGQALYEVPRVCEPGVGTPRVAVLTSRYTLSAGEFVASSLKGVRNIKLIGEITGGLSTTNGWHVLTDEWTFAPAEGYYMSVDGSVHTDGVVPDIEVPEALRPSDLLRGAVIDQAVEWITSS